MGPFQLLFLIFLVIPIAEIYLLIEVGSVIGAGWTIFLVVFTAMLGAYLVKAQGISTYQRVNQQMQQGQLPATEMFEGLFLLVAGALLLTPGFVTDAIGFACLTPPLRRAVIGYVLKRGVIRTAGINPTKPPNRAGSSSPSQTIEGEYRDLNE